VVVPNDSAAPLSTTISVAGLSISITQQGGAVCAYSVNPGVIVDFEAVDANGTAHLMGDIFTASRGLKLRAWGGRHRCHRSIEPMSVDKALSSCEISNL
jgi:hypothetical protein